MVAVMASSTVELSFTGHPVPAGRVDRYPCPWPGGAAGTRPGLRSNGSLALGLAARCSELIGPGPLDEQLSRCRAALEGAIRPACPRPARPPANWPCGPRRR